MRRRDHEKIVHEKDKTIARLERQNQELLDKLLHTAGHTWTLPPRNYGDETPAPPDEFFTTSPEQFLDAPFVVPE